MVIWVIGLAGAGKTTLSQMLYEKIKPSVENLVLLDGDALREVFNNDVDHSVEGRRKNAERLSNLSKFLSDQGIHVIASVLSIFPDWQQWNRENLKDYQQVYLDVSMETLLRRNHRSFYQQAIDGKVKNVVGIDIEFPAPFHSDLVLDNNADREDFQVFVEQVLSLKPVLDVCNR